MTDQKIKKITAKEFRKEGFLREVNRQFLHPLGLAVEVVVDEEGNESFGDVWDYRDDPEGMLFEPLKDKEKEKQYKAIESLRLSKLKARKVYSDINNEGIQIYTCEKEIKDESQSSKIGNS